MSKVLVTGCAGFIGSHLTEALLNIGHTVIGVDNLSSGARKNMESFITNPNFTFFLNDVGSFAESEDNIYVDFVYHLAAVGSVPRSIKDPKTTFDNNVVATHKLLDWAKTRARAFFFASSSSVYGKGESSFKSEEQPLAPISPYGVSKMVGEQYCSIFDRCFRLRTHCFRLFNVFGPRQLVGSEYSALVPKLAEAIHKRESMMVFGDGNQSRDFTFVGDVVNTLITAPNWAREPVYNISTGHSISVLELIRALSESVKDGVVIDFHATRPGDILHSRGSTTRLGRDLGKTPMRTKKQYQSTMESLLEGLNAQV